jgi:DNA-binding NarL/FixJ family response regulator
MRQHRILLVDDHALVRRGLAALLHADGRFRVVAEAGSGEAAIAHASHERPDIVLLDMSMPRMDGLETLKRLRALPNRPRVLILSMYDEAHFVAQALQEGADGYLLKDAMDDELFHALEAVLRGHRYVASAIDRTQVQAASSNPSQLTTREREVLQLIATGHTTQQVADRLDISPHTATRHRANLMQKLGVHNQVELLRVASQRGLILLPRASAGGNSGGSSSGSSTGTSSEGTHGSAT